MEPISIRSDAATVTVERTDTGLVRLTVESPSQPAASIYLDDDQAGELADTLLAAR